MESWIALLDCNNFFVSCERLFRPDLRNRPVVVLSSNDGCVVARSQEIKDKGISMGVPYFQIKDTLAAMQAAVFSSNFALYREVSRRVFSVLREEVDIIEQYSIDEAFFVLGEEPIQAAGVIKQRVEKQVGIPVSIGIAQSKTRAKYVNDRAKKTTGLACMDASAWNAVAPTIPLHSIWGVGGRLSARYRAVGLETVADLCAASPNFLQHRFGKPGLQLQAELSGVSVLPVTPHLEAQKSIMSSRSFAHAVTDSTSVHDAVAYHVRHIAADLRAAKLVTACISVSIRPSRHGAYALAGGTATHTLPVPTHDTFTLLAHARTLTDTLYRKGIPYQKAGVYCHDLRSEMATTRTLFSDLETTAMTPIWQAVDAVNLRAGRELIRVGGSLAATTKWQPRRQTISPAYVTKWTDIPFVQA
jgi:DNA polymerase V